MQAQLPLEQHHGTLTQHKRPIIVLREGERCMSKDKMNRQALGEGLIPSNYFQRSITR